MKNKPRILVFEDDHLQAGELRRVLEQKLSAQIETIGSEHDFRAQFEQIAANPPDLASLDRMVLWAIPDKDMPIPPEEAHNPEQAGVRCAELLQLDNRTASVKVILYSVLGDEDVAGVQGVVKQGDMDNLLDQISDMLKGSI